MITIGTAPSERRDAEGVTVPPPYAERGGGTEMGPGGPLLRGLASPAPEGNKHLWLITF
jgi:hypothetical protein